MKTTLTRSILLALALAAVALPASAAPEATNLVLQKSSLAKIYTSNGNMTANNGTGGFAGGAGIGHWFDGKKRTDTDMWGGGGTYLRDVDAGAYVIIDFSDEQPTGYFITQVSISQCGDYPYSIYWSDDGATWTAVSGAQNVSKVGEGIYGVNKTATHVKLVFETYVGMNLNISEIEVWGYAPVPPTNLVLQKSSLAKIYTSNGNMTANNGTGGFAGGAGIGHWFDGKKRTDTDMWGGGGTYLRDVDAGAYVIIDFSNEMPDGYYITDISISQCGDYPYSLYWSKDGTTWTAVPNAQNVSKVGEGIYGVNKIATHVKLVFETYVGMNLNISEIEVWGLDPDDIACTHENVTDDYPEWSVYQAATCTENAWEERFCPDCGERFTREVLLSSLGHIYVATLTESGTITSYGSGTVTCSREGCDFHIDFDGDAIDFATYGGVPMDGVVQYMNLTTYSQGGVDGGISPADLIDNVWADSWNGFWFAQGLSTNEWIQFAFGTPVEITQIEYSVLNQDQTVYFSKYDPAAGEETLLKTIVIVKDTSDGAPGYQRKTLYFFGGEDANETVTLDALRMRVGDVLDEQGNVAIAYVGTQYGRPYHTCVIEVHPYGTISGAGKKDPGKPMFLLMQ